WIDKSAPAADGVHPAERGQGQMGHSAAGYDGPADADRLPTAGGAEGLEYGQGTGDRPAAGGTCAGSPRNPAAADEGPAVGSVTFRSGLNAHGVAPWAFFFAPGRNIPMLLGFVTARP